MYSATATNTGASRLILPSSSYFVSHRSSSSHFVGSTGVGSGRTGSLPARLATMLHFCFSVGSCIWSFAGGTPFLAAGIITQPGLTSCEISTSAHWYQTPASPTGCTAWATGGTAATTE